MIFCFGWVVGSGIVCFSFLVGMRLLLEKSLVVCVGELVIVVRRSVQDGCPFKFFVDDFSVKFNRCCANSMVKICFFFLGFVVKTISMCFLVFVVSLSQLMTVC